jgi:hypothetical protein
MKDEPQLSLRQLSQQTELSVTSQRIVRKDLDIDICYLWQFFDDRLIHRDLWPALSMSIEAQSYNFQHLL